eukprot:GFYU01005719.1.p1 GENE.GFYU01005719.1~~GFYU01005719.1.p1  ORF type:complete len:207 (+),score=55.25 GFYU01005719.1:127-747(+)
MSDEAPPPEVAAPAPAAAEAAAPAAAVPSPAAISVPPAPPASAKGEGKSEKRDLSKNRPQDMNPAVGDLTVKLLDGMATRMKQWRKHIQTQIDDDKKEVEWIDKEVAYLRGKLAKVNTHHEKVTKQRDAVKHQLDTSIQAMELFMKDSRGIIHKARTRLGRMDAKVATQILEEQQGFSRGRETTFRISGNYGNGKPKKKDHLYYVK